jgi:putative spermidine/putrescine transport system ATP-binding protein
MAFLEIDHLDKHYGASHVVRDFNLAVDRGEFVSFLGPSGCGKTTTLRMVAGFERPDSGAIHIDGRDVVNLKPNQRNIGMVFQAYALFPNMTVAQNVAFGLRIARKSRAESDARVAEMLGMIGLTDLGGRYPFQLSGGQQQRVALARALAPRPNVLLLDEPLSALDAKIRISLRDQIRAIQKELGITTIYVTHDQEEALSMSDRIVVMNAGIAEQVGDPFTIYTRPATPFVASFVGTLNGLRAHVVDGAGGALEIEGQSIVLGRALDAPAGGEVGLSVRPEALALGRGGVSLTGRVEDVAFHGPVVRLRIAVGAQRLALDTFNTAAFRAPAVGETVTLGFDPADALVA